MQETNLATKYILEIYEPDDDSCVAAVFSSDTPFMPLAKGEYINTSVFTMSNPQGILQVVSVEHMLWEIEKSHQTQKVCIRTKKVKDPFA